MNEPSSSCALASPASHRLAVAAVQQALRNLLNASTSPFGMRSMGSAVQVLVVPINPPGSNRNEEVLA